MAQQLIARYFISQSPACQDILTRIENELPKELKEEEKNKGKIIHRERHFGNFSRSFYVGEELEEKDIKAKLENGVLTLDVAKVEAIKKEKEKKYISIE